MPLTFRHSGLRGDFVYGLRIVRELGGGEVHVDHARRWDGWPSKPPIGEKTARELAELADSQDYVSATITDGRSCDYDLDQFRNNPDVLTDHLVLSHWKGIGRSDTLDLSQPWLRLDPEPVAEVVVSVSGRRTRYALDWGLLRGRDVVFVGLDPEWRRFCKRALRIPHYQTASLLEAASVIAGAKLFVGNQSFGWAIAEGLKIPRVLEVWPQAPNCLPQGVQGGIRLETHG